MRPVVRTLVVALAAALLVAGCAAKPPPPQGPEARDAPGVPQPRFRAPITLEESIGGPEPNLVLGDDDWVYVAVQDGRGGSPHFYASGDDGRTWRKSVPTHQSGGEVAAAGGPAGAVYVTQLGTQGNVVSVSHDRGLTWSAAVLAPFAQYFDREWVAADPDGRAYLVAREFGQTASAGSSRSDDRGATWLPQGRAWDAANEPGLGNGNLLATGDALHLAYVCRDARGVCVATSRDAAASWRSSLVVERGVVVDNVYPVVAADAGRVYVAWSDSSDGRLAVWVSSSSDGGATWTAPWRATSKSVTTTLPWITAGSGRVWLVALETPVDLAAADGREAVGAEWTPVALRLDVPAQGVLEKGPILGEPAHVGVLSKPVGRPGSNAPFDRSFGDFFTAEVDARGRLVVAVAVTTAGPSAVEDRVVFEAR